MHIVVGILRMMWADLLGTIYRRMRSEWLLRCIVQQYALAYTAHGGIDDAALAAIDNLGADAVRILKAEAASKGKFSTEARILGLLRLKSDDGVRGL